MKRSNLFRKQLRRRRIRASVSGTAAIPRFAVFRGTKHLFLQLIDDTAGYTLASAHEGELSEKEQKEIKTERARLLGKLLAQKAVAAGIQNVVFDRGGNAYHGRVKAAAEGARTGGLTF
ncbi:50S ribosomal protein L18 [Candidatus Uhrbacteria bacterium]|nr:50S ribosomal protein L18 [Candidatus Uhrbacteria bacterium]